MFTPKYFKEDPRGYLQSLLDECLLEPQTVLDLLQGWMHADDVRSMLEHNLLGPDYMWAYCEKCDDGDFRGMDGVYNDNDEFTCDSCLAQQEAEEEEEEIA